MSSFDDRWLDEDAGPVVRPFALTRGRRLSPGENLDVIAMVTAVRGLRPNPSDLEPEHYALLSLCAIPTSVADLAADVDLPLGVVQILLADLRERSLITIHHPVPPARLPDLHILREVADGLRRL